MPTKKLLEANCERRIFFGFDEIWFFPSRTIDAKPLTASLVGPDRVSTQTLEALGNWMTNNSCSMALGGGTGTNYIVKARGLKKYIVAFSYEQSGDIEIEYE